MKFMIKKSGANTLEKRKVILSTAKVDTSSKKKALIMKDSGGTIKWKEKERHISGKVSWNILVNGRVTNTMDGEFFTRTQNSV